MPRLVSNTSNDGTHDFTRDTAFAAPRRTSENGFNHKNSGSRAGYGTGVIASIPTKLRFRAGIVRKLVENERFYMLTEKTFRPSSHEECQFALKVAAIGDALSVIADKDCEGGYVIVDLDGDAVGYLSKRHWVSAHLTSGRELLHASVNSRGGDSDGNYRITVRIVTGDEGDKYPAWTPTSRPASDRYLETPWGDLNITVTGPAPRRSCAAPGYCVGIVGESYRQAAIRRCAIGDEVSLRHDAANPHDNRAMAVLARGEQIGFLPRGGWLTSAILDQGQQVSASILSMAPGGGGDIGVVLQVSF